MADEPQVFGFTKPVAMMLKQQALGGGSMTNPSPVFNPPGNIVGAWLMEATSIITAAVDASTAGEGTAAIAKRDRDGTTGAELVSHADQDMTATVYNLGPEIASGAFFIGVRALEGTIYAISLPASPVHAKTSGTITARSGATLGSGSVDLLNDDLTTTGVTVTANNAFGSSIATAAYCIVMMLASGEYTIVSVDCP